VLSSAFILDAIRGLAAEGRAVLFSTHILSEVELLCDRVVVIHRGRRIAEDTVDGLMSATQATSLSRAFLQLVHAADEAA
jgi:sodium transport system ATP-binding protein